MSTPPLVTMPSSSCFANMTMSMERAIARTTSPYSYEEQTFKWAGERWMLTVDMPPIRNRAIANEWISFGLKLEGSYGIFLAGDPLGKQPQGVATGTPVTSSATLLSNVLSTTGWTPSVTGILRNGDYIQLGTGLSSRLHRVVEDVNSDGSGAAVLNIVPALRTNYSDGTTITVINPRGAFRLAENTFGWGVSPGGVHRISFNAIEVVNA